MAERDPISEWGRSLARTAAEGVDKLFTEGAGDVAAPEALTPGMIQALSRLVAQVYKGPYYWLITESTWAQSGLDMTIGERRARGIHVVPDASFTDDMAGRVYRVPNPWYEESHARL